MNPVAGQRGKKKSKLEIILRQDHSDIYFDNDRLNDELNNRIESLNKEHHRHEMLRQVEIGKLRREIDELKVLRQTKAEEQLQEINARPHTTGNIDRRFGNVPSKGCKSAKASTVPISAVVGVGGGVGVGVGGDGVGGSKREAPVRPQTFDSYAGGRTSPAAFSEGSESTLRNPKTLRRYRHVKPSQFRLNKKFPPEWYTKSIPASDAVLHKNRRVTKSRGKSAPSFDFLAKLRENEENDRSLHKFERRHIKTATVRPSSPADNMSDISDAEGMSLVCDQPVKPIVMSRRRLMEITHLDALTDRGPSRNTQRLQTKLEINMMEIRRIDLKVKEFCRNIEERKKREAEEEKEREETRRRDAMEKTMIKGAQEDI